MRNDTLNVCGIQTNLSWEAADVNRAQFDEIIEQIPNYIDVIVLPEMFTTGFSMNPDGLAETMDGPTVSWMKNWAAKMDAALCGSIIIEENENYFNRLLFVHPCGKIEHYDKRHLFSFAGEHKKYKGGHQQKIVTFRDWRICLNVCYDLRFPIWARNKNELYDVVLYVANWPEVRIEAWSTLLRARAMENQAYAIGINRIGRDGNDNHYNGQSAIIDMGGNYLCQGHEEDALLIQTLSLEKLSKFRQRFSFLADADKFEITE